MTIRAGAGGLDLTTLARLYQDRAASPEDVVAGLLERLACHPDPAVWVYRVPADALREQARAAARRRAAGEDLPLYGVPFAVKDNIDVANCPTTAGCPAFTYLAERTAPVVARLQAAGALLVGKTNLDQFATGLAGDRSPYGTPRNAFHADYIPGGSSSGSAAAVAAGLVSFALGTDTAGSGRVPAGCNNIVGLKPTPGLLDTAGIVPACRSLDCISVFALTADDALGVCAVAADSWPQGQPAGADGAAPEPGFTFAVPRDEDLEFFGDEGQARLFAQVTERLSRMGGRRREVDYEPLQTVGSLLYDGPWLAERLAGLQDFLARHAGDMHPITRAVVEGGARYTAADVFKGLEVLKGLRPRCAAVFAAADVLVVPTLPALPTLAEVRADSAGWSRRLGHYTNFVNLLGWAALAVPAGFTAGGLPGGITLIGPVGSEARLCALGMAWQRRLNLPLGATGRHLPEARPPVPDEPRPPAEGWVRVAVAGAHLRGQPLHPELRRCGARFVRAARTAPHYRFVALLTLDPPRPGLLRDEARAGSAAVEVYDLPHAGFGRLVASVALPLAIGTVELADGEAVKGFLCESYAAAGARDITDFGGWPAFREHLARHTGR
jgi:allophanate hydrolase